jgi:hypothetical protein
MYRKHPDLGFFQSTLAGSERAENELQESGWDGVEDPGFAEGMTPDQAEGMRTVPGVTFASIATITAPSRMN